MELEHDFILKEYMYKCIGGYKHIFKDINRYIAMPDYSKGKAYNIE